MIKNKQIIRYISLVLVFVIANQIFYPTLSFALTSGPHSPEFSSFEPVNTNQMVDIFSGSFTYNLPVINIPGPDGGGYAMSLSYHSGVSSEIEASWVGLGWTLNPGAITRNKRGYPDDFKDEEVIKYNKTVPNWSVSAVGNANIEFFSMSDVTLVNDNGGQKDTSVVSVRDKLIGNVSLSKSVRFNNYRGFSRTFGFGLGVMGMASLNLSRSGSGWTKDISVNPIAILGAANIQSEYQRNRLADLSDKHKGFNKERSIAQNSPSLGSYSYSDFTNNVYPATVQQYFGCAFNSSVSVGVNTFGPVGFEIGYTRNLNIQANKPQTTFNVYGFMNPINISAIRSNTEDGNCKFLSDYAVDKGASFSKKDHYLGAPIQQEDIFSVNGEGLNGGMRLFHEQLGHFYPNFVKSKQKIFKMGFEAAFGETNEFGLNVGAGSQKNEVNEWFSFSKLPLLDKYDIVEQFPQNEKPFFRFNNDMGGAVSYTKEIDEQIDPRALEVRFLPSQVQGIKKHSKVWDNVKMKSEGLTGRSLERSSIINYNLNSDILANNDVKFEKSKDIKELIEGTGLTPPDNSIMEMQVLNASGNTYTYGLPVFTKGEKNLSIHVDADNADDKYKHIAYSTLYSEGKVLENDIIVGEESPAAYSINHLLTSITTPTYVDVIGNEGDEDDFSERGPGNEDIGGWTKFWYRQWETDNGSNTWFRYRAPYNGLLYDQGALANKDDDMGSVSSGLKQKFYLKAVETKSHVAFFITNKTKRSDFNEFLKRNDISNISINDLSFIPEGNENKRKDGFGAPYETSSSDPAANSPLAQDQNQSIEKLDKIVLCAKNDLTKPLQTTHFVYDYSLCKNVPNSALNDETAPEKGNLGKLTLKRVWFEYNGVVKSKIAPYEFKYRYKKFIDTSNKNEEEIETEINNNPLYKRYKDIITFAYGFDNDSENPDYEPAVLDMWGNNSAERDILTKNKYPWVSQKKYAQDEFDPGAWNLKQIILPSGGEIHIQYEQNDYNYVQDKQVVGMVNLTEKSNNVYKPKETHYYLNPEHVGLEKEDLDLDKFVFNDFAIKQILQDRSIRDEIKREILDEDEIPFVFTENEFNDFVNSIHAYNETDSKNLNVTDEVAAIKEKTNMGLFWLAKLKKYFIEENNLVYFKFLYTMEGGTKAAFENCKSEYITGYTKVNDVGLNPEYGIYLKLGDAEHNMDNVPRTACREYYFSNYDGMLTGNRCGCDFSFKEMIDEKTRNTNISNFGDAVSWRKDVAFLAFDEIKMHIFKPIKGKYKVGETYNPDLSYLRVPLPFSKKGGGCRVKRLLMYDKGIESGDESLFGSEYIYELPDGTSSGVVTNEPAQGREENAMVTLLDDNGQGNISRFMNGMDLQHKEGPIGEPLLPGPSIGYSRVVVQGIHAGKTNTGYTVHEFNTVKDYPMIVKNTSLDKRKHKQRTWFKLNLGLIYFGMDNYQLSQGYSIINQNMHGTQLRQSAFAGRYDPLSTSIKPYVSFSEFEYFDFTKEKLKMLKYDPVEKRLSYFRDTPGKEETVTMEIKRVQDNTLDLGIEFDIWFWTSILSPGWSFGIRFLYDEKQIRTHTNTKVFSYPAIVKKVKSFHENVESETQNLAFDPNTGQPVLTRTSDGFDNLRLTNGNNTHKHDGGYYSLQIPASWIYKYMGPNCQNEMYQNRLGEMAASITTYGEQGNWLKKIENSGLVDEISGRKYYYYSFANDQQDDLGVLSANAVRYKNNWFTEESLDESYKGHLEDLNKVYRVESNHVYKEDALESNWVNQDDPQRIYNGGLLSYFKIFDNWWSTDDYYKDAITSTDEQTDSKWLQSTEVKRYSMSGVALEEQDILGIYSSARYGYNDMLPVMIAQNAPYSSIFFDDFENNDCADDLTKKTQKHELFAHSGFSAFNYDAYNDEKFIKKQDGINNTSQLMEKGALLKLWLHSYYSNNPSKETEKESFFAVVNDNYKKKLNKVASTGYWTLYEAHLDMFSEMPEGEPVELKLEYPVDENEIVYIDDLRFQPVDASSTCSVYDKNNLRLLAQYDNQHFGVYYQYNDEGQLVRKIIETERGPKTIQETHYNMENEKNRGDVITVKE